MSEDTDIEQLIKLMKSLQVAEKTPEPPKSEVKITILAVALASILPICGIIYQMGQTEEELSGGIDKGKLELRADFIEKLAEHKDQVGVTINSVRDDIRQVTQDNNKLTSTVNQLEKEVKELEDNNRTLQRSLDDQYRTMTYLKSQHNINIPPK